MKRPTLADLVLMFAPEMSELIHLREEVQRLRFQNNPPTPTVHELIEDTPIKIKQDDDGRWNASIDCITASTGVGGCDTDVECFRRAVRHVAELAGRQWADEDDE